MSRMHEEEEEAWGEYSVLGCLDSVYLGRTVGRFEFVVGLKRKIRSSQILI